MMQRINKLSILGLSALSTAAWAHPGDHETMQPHDHATHVLTDPWHLLIAMAVAGAAVLVYRHHRRKASGVK